jgi:hypothetical protein
MTTELTSQRPIGTEEPPPTPKMRFHALRSTGLGSRLSGWSVEPASDFSDVAIWMRNGDR